MRLAHSCCPNKKDIRPPEFKLVEQLTLPKGTLDSYICEGCKTVVLVFMEKK